MRYLVSTTQRCGSTWLTQMLERTTNSGHRYIDGTACGFDIFGDAKPGALLNLRAALLNKNDVRVYKSHDIASKDFDAVANAFPDLVVLTISRDFKDIAVSRYFYYRYFWPTQPALGPF